MLRLLETTSAELVDTFASRYAKGPFLATALYREFYRRLNPEAWHSEEIGRSPGLSLRLQNDMCFAPGRIVAVTRSEGAFKFITALGDGCRIESVVLPMRTHKTVCVSSQVGCRMACRFCETARLGLIRQLSTEEIVGQVYAARQRFGDRVRNVVFMGMGEPLDNLPAFKQAVRVLNDPRGLNIAQRHMTVSTVGRIQHLTALASADLPDLRIAVSLNAPNDTLRNRLMPINRTDPLQDLQATLQNYPLKKGAVFMISYVLIEGLNDTPECARQLADWVRPLRSKINLIPFNPGPGIPFRTPSTEAIRRFRRQLIQRGVNAQNRHARGKSLMAGCGQLGSERALK